MNHVVVGLDIGTSSLKVSLGDPDTGKIVANYHFGYDNLKFAAPGVAYLDGYLDAVMNVLKKLDREWHIICISVATQMYSICEMKRDGMTVLQWNCLFERNKMVEDGIRSDLIRSGCQPDTIYGAYKAAASTSEVRTRMVPYGLKEYIIYALTGRLATDYTTASASGLYDVENKRWNLAFIQRLGLNAALLPEVFPAWEVIGTVKAGLFPGSEEIAVVPGFGDGPSASYSCREISNFCGNLGTSMAARVFTEDPDLSGENGLWNYAVDHKRYLAGGISSNSCSVLDWARTQGLYAEENLESKDIMFFPWMHGERMPYWSSQMRGTFVGMQITDNRQNISAAIVKGVAFTFVRMATELEKLKGCDLRLILGGGGTNIKELLDVIRGCIDSQILLLTDADYLCSYGSAMCAAEGVGASLMPENRIRRILEPTGFYQEEYERWLKFAEKQAELYCD